MANGFSIDVPGGGWQAANQGLSDIGAGLGQWARQQQALQLAERQRQNELQDAITILKMKSDYERQNRSPVEKYLEESKLIEEAWNRGDTGLYNFLTGGGQQDTPSNGTAQPFQMPKTFNRAEQFLTGGLPNGLSIMPKSSFGQSQPFGATQPFGKNIMDEYEMRPTGKVNKFGKVEFGPALKPDVELKQKEEELKQKEIIQGVSGDIGGRLTLAKESIKNIDDIRKILFPGGTPESFKRTTAFASNLPLGTLPIFPQRGWGKAEQDVFRKMGVALSGRQLIQTGVAARPEETSRLIAQFAPSVGSNPDAAWNALNELEDFYKSYITETDPEYRFGVKKFEKKQQNTTPAAKPAKQGSFSYLWE